MFDRIAGLYDRMNTVMTAGLHHQWRRRAADLAALSPGDRALDVATGTGDLALELAQRVGPGGEVVGDRLLRADARARARQGERARARRAPSGDSSRPTRSSSRSTMASSTRRRSASARATSQISSRVCARWRASCGPGGRVVVLEITTPQRPPLSTVLRAVVRPVVPALGRLAGDAQAYSYLPSSVRRFPGPRGARRDDVALWRSSGSTTSSRPAASSRCTEVLSDDDRIGPGGGRRRAVPPSGG